MQFVKDYKGTANPFERIMPVGLSTLARVAQRYEPVMHSNADAILND